MELCLYIFDVFDKEILHYCTSIGTLDCLYPGYQASMPVLKLNTITSIIHCENCKSANTEHADCTTYAGKHKTQVVRPLTNLKIKNFINLLTCCN